MWQKSIIGVLNISCKRYSHSKLKLKIDIYHIVKFCAIKNTYLMCFNVAINKFCANIAIRFICLFVSPADGGAHNIRNHANLVSLPLTRVLAKVARKRHVVNWGNIYFSNDTVNGGRRERPYYF